jgi:Tn3 transposase DDE domain
MGCTLVAARGFSPNPDDRRAHLPNPVHSPSQLFPRLGGHRQAAGRDPARFPWGSGRTSSSNGQAFPIAFRKPVIAQVNAKYGRDPVAMFYTHVSDRYAPYHPKAISSTVRDATYVLDGLLDHHTDLQIEEHYTDTSGYTKHIFALCHLLVNGLLLRSLPFHGLRCIKEWIEGSEAE